MEQQTMTETTPTAPIDEQTKTARLRKHLVFQVLLELVIPLGGYYVLRGFGVSQLLSVLATGVLVLPAVAYTVIKQRKVDLMVFPRVLLIRDSWVFGALGLWTLGTLLTSKPFMLVASRAVVVAKIGAEGAREWEARWHVDARFRHHIRTITAVWGVGFTLDAVVRIVLATTLPVDSVPLASTVQWLVVLGGLLAFHIRYVTKHGLKV
jgi:hypothetical protein